MPDQHDHIDKPEPRWQALLAFLAVGAIYLALPRDLIIGPIWLLPTLIVVLLIPTVVTHRAGKRSLNRALGIIINGITTVALIGSIGIVGARTSITQRSGARTFALGRIALADQRAGFRALVLATRWRRANRAARAEEVRQHQFSFPANASPAR